MIGKTMLFNPFTGAPRHPDDIKSDPAGMLVWDGEEPLRAAPQQAQETSLPPQGAEPPADWEAAYRQFADGPAFGPEVPALKKAFAAGMAWQVSQSEGALRAIMRAADAAKEPCGMDPESPAAIRNGKFATIAQIAAQGLGLVRGPALSASPAPAPQEPAARFLLVAMDDDGCGNPVFCADEKAVRAALAPLLFFFNDEHPLSAEHDAEVDAQLEALLEDGFLRFEGDPGINLYKLHAPLYASPAPGELGAVDAAAGTRD